MEEQPLETKVPLNITAPLDKKDREEQEEEIFKNGAPTVALENFVDVVLAEAINDSATLPTLYQLIESHGLVVYDKVIDGKKVSSDKLLNALRLREQQADDLFDDDGFQFWGTLSNESRYSVFRDDVAKVYLHAKKLQFPWKNLANEFVWLSCFSNNSDGTAEKLKLNARYTSESSFKQRNWDSIPSVNQKYWKHRDTFNIIEFAFILREKEPPAKATQHNDINLYPLDFCEFFAELLTQSDSSWKAGRLTEINPPAPYCEEWAGSPDFEREALIKWAVSKEIKIPTWLIDAQQNISTRISLSNSEKNTGISPAKPWLIVNPGDPEPKQDWYISARYFARQLVMDDTALLTKRSLLVAKIAKSLAKVGILKRGGKREFSPETIRKSLLNIKLG